jgi:hypothetical protein
MISCGFTVHEDGSVLVRSSAKSVSYSGNGAANETSPGAYLAPVLIAGLGDVRRTVRFRGVNGGHHSLSIRDVDGVLFGWGINSNGEIGSGDLQPVYSPLQIDLGGSPVVDAQVFLTVSAAVTSDGRVFGWGAASQGNLRRPTQVPGLTDVRQLRLAWANGFALTTTGRVYFWKTYEDVYRPREIVLRK